MSCVATNLKGFQMKVFTYLVYAWSVLALVPMVLSPLFPHTTSMTMLALSGLCCIIAVCCAVLSEEK